MSLRLLLGIAIALLLLYGGWQLLRAVRGGWRAGRADRPAPQRLAPVTDDDAPDDDEDDGGFDYAPLPAAAERAPAPVATPAAAPAPVRSPPPAGPDAFQLELELQRLRREVAGLRAALDVQQQEIGGLHDSLRTLREQLESGLAGQNASPEYSEALVFARRGLPVEAIAERCGITVAEAELVRALAARSDDGAAR
ncbi:hypothetical protein dqs_0484 [Azoarcus olearius]|uniref:DUF2802 domain-containing protein n=1 Tax=Azoarcus sp. (strain BH72) TaxID=418699 RepID=UPI0008062CC5|nr:DUF2802 domain-containing protein [Azoarcus olearius]ANQ83560.1 hypothetical protein dqs_0484 [Azoarcus olearius]